MSFQKNEGTPAPKTSITYPLAKAHKEDWCKCEGCLPYRTTNPFKVPEAQPVLLLGGPIPESVPETKNKDFDYVCCEQCGIHTRLVERNATLWCWDCYRAFFYGEQSAVTPEPPQEKFLAFLSELI